ncbi:daptide biosynthesis RiPP recognition protein [Streptomyces sp. NPDC050600]|uniref:daptide biosynthesis RiPP recognition protein n=1 Tax=Streptomyces sp. NPDC050600 TaxID=3157213 RepID=UPI00344668BD
MNNDEGRADRLSAWFSGDDTAGARAEAVLVQSGGDLRTLAASGLCAPGAQVFSDGPAEDLDGTGLRHVPVEGGVEHAGDELILSGGLYVQVFDYGSLPFLSVAGPTVVRVMSPEDHDAFLDDADRAVQEGAWPEGLAHASVQLADVGTLVAPARRAALGRLFVTAGGQVRTGVGGADLGAVEQGPDALLSVLADHGGDPSLDAVVPRERTVAAATARPWLERYARALDIRRRLTPKWGPDIRISGFGGRFTPGPAALPVEDATHPLLVRTADAAYAVPSAGNRMFRLGTGAALLLEVFATASDGTGTAEAAERAGQLLDIAPTEALEAYHGVVAGLAGRTTGAGR